MSEGKILIVEDEPSLSAILRDYLQAAGYTCQQVFDGSLAVTQFKALAPDLVLLDLTLPGKDGIEICRDLRAFSDAPIIMVTARVEEVDRLLGLETGADDYVCKPYSPREVVARVKAVLRRHHRTPGDAVAAGLSLDDAAGRASLFGQDLGLTQVEFRLLRTLAAEPGRIYSRDQLMDHLYLDRRVVTDRAVDSHIKNLRRKMGESGDAWIHSVYGAGYRFES
ncbi:response regulator [Silvimonas iriomotensis]|uniref:DNA-binding response regulator n=1 Tax=Silvimonas iriomotensis TaxID=449662 RepID=A0ABQ2PB71_9NEIS|nr:response regulator [Silvimonas iriomotensis]GGP22329.1 DNA-binding response regulator [Silvimonas iriomotensis]